MRLVHLNGGRSWICDSTICVIREEPLPADESMDAEAIASDMVAKYRQRRHSGERMADRLQQQAASIRRLTAGIAEVISPYLSEPEAEALYFARVTLDRHACAAEMAAPALREAGEVDAAALEAEERDRHRRRGADYMNDVAATEWAGLISFMIDYLRDSHAPWTLREPLYEVLELVNQHQTNIDEMYIAIGRALVEDLDHDPARSDFASRWSEHQARQHAESLDLPGEKESAGGPAML